MEQSKSNYLECQEGGETSKVPPSHRKIITPLAEYLRIEQKTVLYEVLYMIHQQIGFDIQT